MQRLILFFLGILFSSNIYTQIGPTYKDNLEFDSAPRFWMDPDGIIHEPNQIDIPDKSGLWIFFRINENLQNENLFTRYVHCLQDGTPRSASLNQETITISPNPADQYITIYSSAKVGKFEITDLEGRLIWTQNIEPDIPKVVDTSQYANGMYVLKVLSKESYNSTLFVIE